MADIDIAEARRLHSDWVNRGESATEFLDFVLKNFPAMCAEMAKLRLIAKHSLANNLCSDHFDKQKGKPCLACELERLSAPAVAADAEAAFRAAADTIEATCVTVDVSPDSGCPFADFDHARCVAAISATVSPLLAAKDARIAELEEKIDELSDELDGMRDLADDLIDGSIDYET